ncbi:polysaccharide pyruvyl transferase family protein [Sutcliffiella rhizosphaerae]|uniref:Polysaccharide pyruvyl transferase domain-containing protein n=1 Tax=Sutcliffiella rhizosphaerae TaxID=2880967 RepID=A0ABN8AH51_9BACI|nr:polysaccharide pyruvyl transferase family protein [Sutcliffiella rhizosphaerae]CAG9622822.1 hypothetical protein BACCIP111883_03613 [Sutcliffiella rhizosphaerae]
MKIGVGGYYGQGNFGDELFLETFKQVFHKYTVYPIISHIDMSASDAIIVGGGDLIIPYSYNNYYFPNTLTEHKTWIYGIGIVDFYPPDTWPAEEVDKYREVIKHSNGLYVRDENSVKHAEYMQLNDIIKQVPDIAFSYAQPNYPIIKNPNKKTIGICSFSYEEFPIDKLARILSSLPETEYALSLIAVVDTRNIYSDYETCVALKNKILGLNPKADITIKKYQYLDVTYSCIQSLDYLVSFKLHPSLVAIRNLVPTFCLSKLSKVKSLMKSFYLEEYFCSYEAKEEIIKQTLNNLLLNGKKKMENISSKIKEIEQKSDAALDTLKKEIEKSQSS